MVPDKMSHDFQVILKIILRFLLILQNKMFSIIDTVLPNDHFKTFFSSIIIAKALVHTVFTMLQNFTLQES